jgi:hypothetical protein
VHRKARSEPTRGCKSAKKGHELEGLGVGAYLDGKITPSGMKANALT